MLKIHARQNTYSPPVSEVELLEENPHYELIQHPDGRQSSISLRDWTPDGWVSNAGNGSPVLESITTPRATPTRCCLRILPRTKAQKIGDTSIPAPDQLHKGKNTQARTQVTRFRTQRPTSSGRRKRVRTRLFRATNPEAPEAPDQRQPRRSRRIRKQTVVWTNTPFTTKLLGNLATS